VNNRKKNLISALIFYLIFLLGATIITTIFNVGNGVPDYKDTVHGLLKGSAWVILGVASFSFFVYYTVKEQLRENIFKISSLIMVSIPFIILSFETSVMGDLWDNYGFPAANIYTGLPNVSPFDPFQHLILFPIFLMRNSCERLLVFGKKYLLKKIRRKRD